jgi:hypothetical protein
MTPRMFIVQLTMDDLHMLIMLLWFQHALQDWIKIPLPHNVLLS